MAMKKSRLVGLKRQLFFLKQIFVAFDHACVIGVLNIFHHKH
jgi:hypothetical protein